jgi:putative DNA primase/helicase
VDVTLTFFTDRSGSVAEQKSMALPLLAKQIEKANAACKDALPLLKAARFGQVRSVNGSLRTNGNVVAITGIEGDYDAGRMSFDEAVERLDKAGVIALVYTTASHTSERPRWRVICPTLIERPPGQRERLVDRLNGLLGGVLGPESWTLSQAFYYGHVNGNPAPRVEIVDGLQTIDQADELDETAIGKPNGRDPDGRDPDTEHVAGEPEAPIEDIAAALEAIPNNDLSWDGEGGWNYIAMAVWRASGGSEDGFAAFDQWSAKSAKYDADETAARWEHFFCSPPNQLGFGTLVHYARLAEPDWEPPSRRAFAGFGWGPSSPQTPDLPQIQVEHGKRHVAADAGIAALVAVGTPIYRRGAQIVRVVRIPAKASDGRTILVPGIMAVPVALLLRELGKAAVWMKFDGRSKKLVRIDPPNEVAAQIMTMADEWPFAPLLGVIGTPTLRPDGSLLDQPGYDPATGLVLFDPPAMPAIPEHPDRAAAVRALILLNSLLNEFPFSDNAAASRAVALSMLMTPVLRGAVGPAVPLHVVKAPAGGTGKSYLGDLAAAIATGEVCPVLSVAPRDEETEKRLHSAALSGQPFIAIDNCNGPLRSQFLCQAIERPLLQIRSLGGNELPRIGNNTTCFANGNNIEIAEDLVRRTVQSALDANMDEPETRIFQRSPLKAVLADRGRYVAAVLTIARAFISAGMPRRPAPFMSFDRWSDVVRGSLMWLGVEDPVKTVAKLVVADPVRERRGEIFAEISRALPRAVAPGVKTSEIAAAVAASEPLRAALVAVAGARDGTIDLQRLGNWLRQSVNVRASGYKLLRNDSDAKRPKWIVQAT